MEQQIEPHPLWTAARNGNLQMVEEILKNCDGPEFDFLLSGDLRGEGGQHPIHAAIEMGNLQIVDLLLNSGLISDFDVRDAAGRSPMFYAALMGNDELIERFLALGCDVDARTIHGWRPLHAALGGRNAGVVGYHLESAEKLIIAGADVHGPTDNGCTPLHYACCVGFECLSRSLVMEHHVNVNAVAVNSCFSNRSLPTMECSKKTNEQLPLHLALEGGHTSIARFLITEANCDIHRPDSYGKTPLWLAAKEGLPELVKIMIDKGADINVQVSKGKTPLMATIGAPRQKPGHKQTIEHLLENGALITMENENQMSALSLAVKHGYTDICERIFEYGGKMREAGEEFLRPDQMGTLLHSAIRYRHFSVVQLLLIHGADISWCDKDGRTPLHKSVMGAHTETCRYLVRQGVALSVKDLNGRTPLDLAVFGLANTDLQKLTKPWVRPWSIIVLLIQAGAMPTKRHALLFESILSSRRELSLLEGSNPRIQLTECDYSEQNAARDLEMIFCWCLKLTEAPCPLKASAKNSIRKTIGTRLGTLVVAEQLSLPEQMFRYLVIETEGDLFKLW